LHRDSNTFLQKDEVVGDTVLPRTLTTTMGFSLHFLLVLSMENLRTREDLRTILAACADHAGASTPLRDAQKV